MENLRLTELNNYLGDQGIYVNLQEFDFGVILPLSTVNVVKENRVNSKSKQTHIHVTGKNSELFYRRYQLDNAYTSTIDERINISLLGGNLSLLSRRYSNLKGYNCIDSFDNAPYSIETSTVKKIAVRADGSKQVQLSKKSEDGYEFKMFRNFLMEGDVMIILKYANTYSNYLCIGIPKEDFETYFTEVYKSEYIDNSCDSNNYDNDYENIGYNSTSYDNSYNNSYNYDNNYENTSYDNNSYNYNSNSYDNNNNRNNSRGLKKVTAEDIATTNFKENDWDADSEERLVSIAHKRRILRERTLLHQDIVKNVAQILEMNGYELYESVIDCLAVKDYEVLICEVKTIRKDDEKDARKQVRKALSQLLFYKHFRLGEYSGDEYSKRMLCIFDNPIDSKYVDFLKIYGIECFVKEYDSFTQL